ncbi:hypothetical protein V6N12_017199 [Hibiscus sabdariffa]|uniref:Uncharacterized protein n=1 Tax=Hibiscus sabdariffa TaxID=183260 RepID=A0ABR1Z6H4_9ROSI
MERPENETKHDDGEQAMEADDLQPNATFLTDLNLLIVALSLTSVCSDEEGFHLDDTQNKDNNNIKGNIPRLKPRKRKTNDHALQKNVKFDG